MACYCFEWATGNPVCIGRDYGLFGGNTVEDCRIACRRRGMAAYCHDADGACGFDRCSGSTAWAQHLTGTLRTVIPELGIDILRYTWGPENPFHYTVCSTARPAGIITVNNARLEAPFHGLVLNLAGDGNWFLARFSWLNSGLDYLYEDEFGHGWNWHYDQTSLIFINRYAPLCSSLSHPLKTPCCLPSTGQSPAHCEYIMPIECVARCGQPYEGTLDWNLTNPCTASPPPCDRYPCYGLTTNTTTWRNAAYPTGRPEQWGAWEGSHPWCRIRTLPDCGTVVGGGAPRFDSRSCFEPREGTGTGDGFYSKCVQGEWAPAYRPAHHKPPNAFPAKVTREGSTEIASRKPERPSAPHGTAPSDCAYHYGDVSYVRSVPAGIPLQHAAGSAMGTICAERVWQKASPTAPCGKEKLGTSWCPVMYGSDGNARFTCGYSVVAA